MGQSSRTYARGGRSCLNAQIADINSRYEAALADTAAGSELQARLDAIRAEGREISRKTLKAFKYIQDHFIGIILTFEIVIKHEAYQRNIALLEQITGALENGRLAGDEKDPGALDLAWQINGSAEFTYYSFSPETCKAADSTLFEETNPGRLFWGTGKGFTFADTSEATVSLLQRLQMLSLQALMAQVRVQRVLPAQKKVRLHSQTRSRSTAGRSLRSRSC